MRLYQRLPSFSSVAKGETAVLTFPIGATYDQVVVKHTGVTAAQIKNIKIKVNGKQIATFKHGTDLNKFNDRYQYKLTAGYLDFHFKRDEMKTLLEQRALSLGTSNVFEGADVITSVTIEFDIDAGAAAPVLKAFAYQSDVAPFGICTKNRHVPLAISAGENEIDNIVMAPNTRILAVHVVTAATVDQLKVQRNGATLYDLPTDVIAKLNLANGRNAQADWDSVDFVLEGDIKQAVSCDDVQDFRLTITAADDTVASTPAYLIVEYVSGLAGL
ncbi:hypothetical protein Ssed_2197 [Shewanella sediminis HAW-EB3]|uniref:Uncharacterized protein n=1 Tax=Shewanella sediminis (strain HAW-EB3) TaxID=425104 RepID=A8FVD3_SHESH|nr:major capsid protein P2 [Shewanella sediminis]ABV36806.1 hypothetical protein Ssed_2197 [Shewanella sediminis HAW-EB3]